MRLLFIPLAFITAIFTHNAIASPPKLDLLEGDKRLACEALLCLSSPEKPTECQPSLKRYFSIHHRKAHKTVSARKNFLKLCPQTDSKKEADNIIENITKTSNCDADSLNEITYFITTQKCDNTAPSEKANCETIRLKVISNELPTYCKAYMEAGYIDIQYVGDINKGTGRWKNL